MKKDVRVVVLGGGFGGVTTARRLERALRGHDGVEITLVSRENFFVMTPLLFEACSGRLELRHCAQPIRAALRRTRCVEATVEHVDVERQIVRAVASEGAHEIPYDHLVVALGASTNQQLIPGSSNAFTFKTMADALVLRNHLIEQFERADAASESLFQPLGTMASLGHTRGVARVFGVRLTGFLAWWIRRTYYLFQMPRWDRRLRIVLDWTVALFFRPDITKVELRVERDQVRGWRPVAAAADTGRDRQS